MDGVKPADSMDILLSNKPREAKPGPGRESSVSSRNSSRSSFAQMLKKTSQNTKSTSASSNSPSAPPAPQPVSQSDEEAAQPLPKESSRAASETKNGAKPSEKRKEIDGSEDNGIVPAVQPERISDAVPSPPLLTNEVVTPAGSADAAKDSPQGDAQVAGIPEGNPELLPVSPSELPTPAAIGVEPAADPPVQGNSSPQVSTPETSPHASESPGNAVGEHGEPAFAPGIDQFTQPTQTTKEVSPPGQVPVSGIEEGQPLEVPLDPADGAEETQVTNKKQTTGRDQQNPFSVAFNLPQNASGNPVGSPPTSLDNSLRPVAPLQQPSATGENLSSELTTSNDGSADFLANLQEALKSEAETSSDGNRPLPGQPVPSSPSSRPAGGSETAVPTPSSLDGKPADAETADALANRIGTTVMQALNGGKVMRMRMYPPELGILQIEVTSVDGAVTARLDVENAKAHRAILENLPQLHEMLNRTHTHVEKIELNILDSRAGFEGASGQSRNPASQGNSSGQSFSPNVFAANEPRDSRGDSGSLDKPRPTNDWQTRTGPLAGIDIQV